MLLFTKTSIKKCDFDTCIATGKSSAKSGGKKRSACFFVKDGFPTNKNRKIAVSNNYKFCKLIQSASRFPLF